MNNNTRNHYLHARGLTSLLAGMTSLLMMATGIVLFITPKGRVAHWMDWRILSLGKEQWASVHITVAILFVIVTIIHLLLNWKVFWSYLTKNLSAGRHLWLEIFLATIVCVAVVAGTLWNVPPFQQIVELNEDIKAHWDSTIVDIPYAHAEDSPLWEFAERVGLSPEELAAALDNEGFLISDVDMTIKDFARKKNISPLELFQAIRKQHPDIGKQSWKGKGKGGGAGHRGNR